MPCIHGSVGGNRFILSVAGPVLKIMVGARLWHFENHRIFGPMPVHKRTGNGLDGTAAFWEAVTFWAQQGERVDDAGVCRWDRPDSPPLYHLGGRNYTEDAKFAARYGVTQPVKAKKGTV